MVVVGILRRYLGGRISKALCVCMPRCTPVHQRLSAREEQVGTLNNNEIQG